MSSGIDTEGRILTIKQYMASGGPGSQGGLQEGNDIRYEFMNASNLPCEGKLLILTRRTSHIEELRENAPITITYLRDEPTVNIPKHFISDKMVPVLEYRRRISYLLLGCFVFCAVMGVLFCLEPPV